MASVEVDVSGPAPGPALPTDLIARALEALDDNDKSLNGRLVSKDICSYLNQPHHRTARFKMPLPASASDDRAWQPHIRRAYRQLPFHRKVDTLVAAATSGSEANLALAWGLVRPSVSLAGLAYTPGEDPGAAAVRSGHLHLLPWMRQHGCIKNSCETLVSVLERCGLPDVQRVWELLGSDGVPFGGFSSYAQRQIAIVAARSAGPAMATLSWLLSVMADPATQQCTPSVLMEAAVGAAESGNLPVLRWLCAQGLDMLLRSGDVMLLHTHGNATHGERVLCRALQHEHLAVAEWLVDEMRLPLPLGQEQEQQREQESVWRAAGSGGSGEAVRWLLRRGVPVHGAAIEAAAKVGKLETVWFLRTEHDLPLTELVFTAAAGSGSVPVATWLLQAGCPMSAAAYPSAASTGDANMLRWLAQEAGCPWDSSTLSGVISSWPSGATGMDSLEATVRELVAAGCPADGGTDDADSVGRAAQHGHLALVCYLHEELGAVFAPGTLALAAAGGCEPVIEWLVAAGCMPGGCEPSNKWLVWVVCEWEADIDRHPYARAGIVGDVDTMVCLRRLGVPWGEHALYDVTEGGALLPSIRWLVEQGAPWDEAAVQCAVGDAKAMGNFKDTVAWFEERLEMELRMAMEALNRRRAAVSSSVTGPCTSHSMMQGTHMGGAGPQICLSGLVSRPNSAHVLRTLHDVQGNVAYRHGHAAKRVQPQACRIAGASVYGLDCAMSC